MRPSEASGADFEATVDGEAPTIAPEELHVPSAEVSTPAVRERIGKFSIRRVLGKGGMGIVYAAFDDDLERDVALKLLQPGASKNDERKAQLLREAQSMAKVSHPNVIVVFEVGRLEDFIYIAMELIRGRTIRRWLDEVEPPWESIVEAFVDAGRGLAAVHQAGLIHRDFKPDNVMVRHDGVVKVLDFGLAFTRPRISMPSADVEHPSSTPQSGPSNPGFAGTLAYMSPEQMGFGDIDARCDQFSFCAALFEGLFGHRPFVAGENVYQTIFNVLNDRTWPVPPDADVPPAVVTVLRKGLSRHGDDRYRTMTELVRLLGATLQRPPPAERRGARRAWTSGTGWRYADNQPLLELADAVVSWGRPAQQASPCAVAVPRDRARDELREAYCAHARLRAEVPSAPLLDVIELVDEPGRLALMFDVSQHVPLAHLAAASTDIDVAQAIRVAIGIADAIHRLKQLGLSADALALGNLMVRVTDYAVATIEPAVTRPAAGRGTTAATYALVGEALQALLALGHRRLPRATEAGSRGPSPVSAFGPGLHEVVAKLRDPVDGYASRRGVVHDLEHCLQAWEADGRIPAFEVGTRDTSRVFRFPSVLHGRAEALEQGRAVLDRVAATGEPELLLVTGSSGTGKSAFIHSLCDSVGHYRIFSGKFNQFGKAEPYATIVEPLRAFLGQLTDAPEHQLQRDRIRRAIERNAYLLFDLVPELRGLFPSRGEAAELPTAEAAVRFRKTLQALLQACAHEDTPVIMVLDDLQWSDAASMQLIAATLRDEQCRNLLWIGAARDDEIPEGHPMHALVAARAPGPTPAVRLEDAETVDEDEEAEEAAAARRHTIHLGPLSVEGIEGLVGDVLGGSMQHVTQVASFVMDRTDGNPLFARALISSIRDQGLLRYSDRDECWTWDPEQVRSATLPDTIVQLMSDKIGALSGPARELMMYAACVGKDVEEPLLRGLLEPRGVDADALGGALDECVESGLLLEKPDRDRDRGMGPGRRFTFAHDQVQQAAYGLLDASARQRASLDLGRLLLARLSPERRDRRLFQIVGYLNAAREIAPPEVRARLVELDLAAGKRALVASAFDDAARLLRTGLSLLHEPWKTDYELAYELHLSLMHAEAMAGRHEAEDRLFRTLCAHVQTDVHVARTYELRVVLDSCRGAYREAISRGVTGLAKLGESVPSSGRAVQTLLEFALTWWAFRRHPLMNLIRRSSQCTPVRAHVLRLLVAMSPSAYVVNSNLTVLFMLRIVRRSLRWGTTEATAYGLAGYGLGISGLLERYETARRLCRVAYGLNERYDAAWVRPKIDLIAGIFVLPWTTRFEECEPILERGETLSSENADFKHAAYNAAAMACVMYYRGERLARVRETVESMRTYTRRGRDEDMDGVLVGLAQVADCLAGKTAATDDLSAEGWDEESFSRGLSQDNTPVAMFSYRALRIGVLYLHGHWELACQVGREARRLEFLAFSNPALAEYLFYHAMSAMSLLRQTPALPWGQRIAARRTVARATRRFRRWQQSCPENFAARYHLLVGEAHRCGLRGRRIEALHYFHQAMEAARRYDRPHNEALASELAALVSFEDGNDSIGREHHARAIALYERWGATTKAAAMRARLLEDGEARRHGGKP